METREGGHPRSGPLPGISSQYTYRRSPNASNKNYPPAKTQTEWTSVLLGTQYRTLNERGAGAGGRGRVRYCSGEHFIFSAERDASVPGIENKESSRTYYAAAVVGD